MNTFDELELLKNSSNLIQKKAAEIFDDKYLIPTSEEYKKVKKIILDYIKKKKRIIYGGYAQNELIKKKDINDDFYGNSRADVEIYSPKPLEDLIELCDILNKERIFSIKGDEGVHEETYKLFANFENYADISYMDPYVYENCPTIELDGLIYTHPHFMLVDAYRVYTDPMTSFFRLDKNLERFPLLERHYPFDTNYFSITYEEKINKKLNLDILRFIRKNIIHKSKLVVVGHYAVEYLTKKVEDKSLQIPFYPYYELISSNYRKDRDKISSIFKSKYGDKVSYKKHYKFFMFWDERSEFYYEGQLILKLFGNNERCIVYNYSDAKLTNFATYQLVICYLLIDYNYAIITNNKIEKNNFLAMLDFVLKAKNKYLDENDKNVLDITPFQHLTLKCIGEPVDPIRQSRLNGLKNLEKGRAFKYNYYPKMGKKGKVPNIKFKDKSGKEIPNKKN